tara:strand:+ start:5916 stop:7064 length:1149 start_codon:yes stop_codon:yes gene_type:complete
MAVNMRIFWATQGLVIMTDGKDPSGSYAGSVVAAIDNHDFASTDGSKSTGVIMNGVQSVGITTTFNLEQVFELGQLSIYENIENIPDIEVTVERVLDGTTLAYAAASPNSFDRSDGTAVASQGGLVAGANDRCDVLLAVYEDTATKAGDVQPKSQVFMSGMYVSSVSYTVPVDGNATESVTLVGNAKAWLKHTNYGWQGAAEGTDGIANKDLGFGTDSPADANGVQRRQEFNLTNSKIPGDIPGTSSDSSAGNAITGTTPDVHIQNWTCSADFGRESIFELGQKGPYHRYVTFPVEITNEFEVISTSGDLVGADEKNDNLTNRNILIELSDGTQFDFGGKNKLQSVGYTGGDTGGGNVSMTFSYLTFNDFSVKTPSTGGNAP